MSTQSKTLSEVFPNDPALELWSAYCDKMVEVDRLTEVNKELVEALKMCIDNPWREGTAQHDEVIQTCKAAITKAEAVK
jgi:hypothetical protein